MGQNHPEYKYNESEVRYRRLFETARDGILILESDTGKIQDINPFLEKLLGYSGQELLGKKFWETEAFRNIRSSHEVFQQLKINGYAHFDELELLTRDGRLIEVEFVSNNYMAGNILITQCHIRDISERKKMEAAILAGKRLEEEKLKAGFIADATHELRTPLAIIKGNVDLALYTRNKSLSSAHSAFRAIDEEVQHLSNLLMDLTLLTSARNPGLERKITSHKISLLEIITGVVRRCRTLANRHRVSIHVRFSPALVIWGDKMYLEKLFVNIITNAILYCRGKGRVDITGSKTDDFVNVSVSDNGIGIPEKEIPLIFERFHRADKARAVNHEGTGLGLAISKWVAEIHGGNIKVSSTEGKGSVFTVSFLASKQT